MTLWNLIRNIGPIISIVRLVVQVLKHLERAEFEHRIKPKLEEFKKKSAPVFEELGKAETHEEREKALGALGDHILSLGVPNRANGRGDRSGGGTVPAR